MLVIQVPLEKARPPKLKSKWNNLVKKMIRSGEACEDAKAKAKAGQKKRDKYADTPERKAALAKATANIQGLKGWDYFTMPNYIVLYSWDFEKPAERAKAKKEAEYYSSRLEKMRDLFIESYPLDPTGTKAIMPDPKSIPDPQVEHLADVRPARVPQLDLVALELRRLEEKQVHLNRPRGPAAPRCGPCVDRAWRGR